MLNSAYIIFVSAFMPMPGASGGSSGGTPYPPPYPLNSQGYQPPAQGYPPYPLYPPSSMYQPPVASSIGCYPPTYPPTSSASSTVSF